MSEFADTMQPIIELAYSQMRMEQENEVMKAVQSVGVNVDKERLVQALTDARKFWDEGYVAGRRNQPRWISVEERLPEKSVPVLAYKDGRIWYCERNWQSGCWESLSFAATKEYGMYWSKGPTHWMPLPEPPKEEV